MKQMKLFPLAWPIFVETALFMLFGFIDYGKKVTDYYNSTIESGDGSRFKFIGQYLGAEKKKSASKIAALSISFNVISGLVISIFLLLLCRPIMTLMGAKDEIMDFACQYLSVVGGYMTSENIRTVSVNAAFDDCQTMVKAAFDDEEVKQTIGLNSANSINISRLLAQVSYYFEAVAQLPKDKRDKVVFSVPCGNFGNITAGLIAKALGLKARFVISCNANDTVPRYLKSGNWEPHQTVATLSNAMDISRPNNWPRVEALVKMQGWKLSDFDFGSLSDAQTETTMQTLYKKTGYIAEPHAAIAYQVLADNLKEGETGIFLGTAHPAKFKGEVDRILNIDLPLPEALASRVAMDSLAKTLPADYDTLKKYVLEALELN